MKISPYPLDGKESSPSHKQLLDLQKKIAVTADIQALKVVLETSTSEEVFQDEMDLHDWIPALNRIDDALECGIPQVSLVHMKEVKGLGEGKGLELEYSYWVGILEACVRFTRLLLSNSTGRNIYNSVDRLEALLFAREEVLADEALGCMCALAMPPYPHRGGHDISPDLKIPPPWLSNVNKGRADKLLLLMAGWGGLTQGVGMLDCTISDTKTLPQHAGDLIFECKHMKFTERALHRTGETSGEAFTRIVSVYKVPADCQFALLVNIRVAVGLGSVETRRKVVARRLLALLTLSLADPLSPLLLRHYESYPDFVQELIDLVRVQLTPCQSVPYNLSSLALRCLTTILSAPGGHGGALRAVSRNSNIFGEMGMVQSQYSGLVLRLIRHSTAELMSPKDENSRGALYYEWMESILSLVHAVVNGDAAEVLVESGLLGTLLMLLKKWQIFQSKGSSENEWSSSSTPSSPHHLLCLMAHAIHIVEAIATNDSISFNEFGDEGMGVLVSVLSIELKHLGHTSSPSPSLSVSYGDERGGNNDNSGDSGSGSCRSSNSNNKGSLMKPSLAQKDFIHSVLSCLSKLVHRQSFTQSNESQVLQGMEMTNIFICLFRNMHTCGGDFAAFAVVLVSDIMNHDPLYGYHVKSSGIAGSFIRSLKSGLPPCAPLIMAIPGMLCSLCLVSEEAENSGATAQQFSFGLDTLQSFLGLFASPEFVLPSSRCLQQRVPSVVGSGLEEFMRHVPKLKMGCTSAIVAVMKRIVSTAADQAQRLVHQYVVNMAKLLEPILCKSGHLRNFFSAQGLNVLSELFPISLLSPRSLLANLSCRGIIPVNNTSREFHHFPGHFLAIHALGVIFKNLCAQDPGRFVEHLCIALEHSMEAVSSCCTALIRSNTSNDDDIVSGAAPSVSEGVGGDLVGILRCVSPNCLSVPLQAVAVAPPNPGSGGEGTLSPYLESYAKLLKEFVCIEWLNRWINLALSRCIHQRRTLGISFLNSPKGRRILDHLVNLQKSAVAELCLHCKNANEKNERECCCHLNIPVPLEIFIIRIVRLAGAAVHSGVSIANSNQVCTLDMGTVLPAFDRELVKDSEVVRYRTSYGWVSDYDTGGYGYPISEVIDLKMNTSSNTTEIEPPSASVGSSNIGSDGHQLEPITAATKQEEKEFPVYTLREAGMFVLQNFVDGVTDIIGTLGKVLVNTSSPYQINNVMQDRIDLTQLASDTLMDFLHLEIPPVPAQQHLFATCATKLVMAVLFDEQCQTVNVRIFWNLLTLNGNAQQTHGKNGTSILPPRPGKVLPMDTLFSICISGVFREVLKAAPCASSSSSSSSHDESDGGGGNAVDRSGVIDEMKPPELTGLACISRETSVSLLKCFCNCHLVNNRGHNNAPEINTLGNLTIMRHYIVVRLAEAVFDMWSDPNLGHRSTIFLEPFLSCVGRIIISLCSAPNIQGPTINNSSSNGTVVVVGAGGGGGGSSPPPSNSLLHGSGTTTALNEQPTETVSQQDGQRHQQLQPELSETTLLAAMECGFTRDHILQGYRTIQSNQIEMLMDWLLSHPMSSSSSPEGNSEGITTTTTSTTTISPSDSVEDASLSSCNKKNNVENHHQYIKDIGKWLEITNEKCEAFLSSLSEVCIRLAGTGGPGINSERNSYVAGLVKEVLSLQSRSSSDVVVLPMKITENQDKKWIHFFQDLVKISTDELLFLSGLKNGNTTTINNMNNNTTSRRSCTSSHDADKVANHLHLLILLMHDENPKRQLLLRKLNLHIILLRSVHETVQHLQSYGDSGRSSWPSYIAVCFLLLDSMISFLVIDNESAAAGTVTTTQATSPSVVNDTNHHPNPEYLPAAAVQTDDPLLSIIPVVNTLLAEDFAIELTVELSGILVKMQAGSIPPAPSGVMQAMLQLLCSLLKSSKCVATLWEKLGEKGMNILFYLPASCSFKGHISLIALILCGILKGSMNSQAIIESKIRENFVLLSQKSTANGRSGFHTGEVKESVRLFDLLNVMGSLIAQDRVAFVAALRSQLVLLKKDQPSNRIIVVLKDQQPQQQAGGSSNNGKEEEGLSSSHYLTALKNILYPLTSCMLQQQRQTILHDMSDGQELLPPPPDNVYFISTVDAALLLSEVMNLDPVCCSTLINIIYFGKNAVALQNVGKNELSEEAQGMLLSVNHCIPGCIPPDPSVISFILHKLIFLSRSDIGNNVSPSSSDIPNSSYNIKKQSRKLEVESIQAGILLILNLIKGSVDVCKRVCVELVRAMRCDGLDNTIKLSGSDLVPLAYWSELSFIFMIVGEHLHLNSEKCHGSEKEEEPSSAGDYLVKEGLFSALFNVFSRLDLEKETAAITPAATTAILLHNLQNMLRLHRWKVLELLRHRVQQVKQEGDSRAADTTVVLPISSGSGSNSRSQTAARRRRDREDHNHTSNITIIPGGTPFTIQLVDESGHRSSDIGGQHGGLSNDVLEAVLVGDGGGGTLALDSMQSFYHGNEALFMDGSDQLRISREIAQDVSEVDDDIVSDEENDELYGLAANFQGFDDILVECGMSTPTSAAIPSLFLIVRDLLRDNRLRFNYDSTMASTRSGLLVNEDHQSPLRIYSNILGLTNCRYSGGIKGSGGLYPRPCISPEPDIHPLLQHNHYQHWQRGNRQRRRSSEDLEFRIQTLLDGSVSETFSSGIGTQTSLAWICGDTTSTSSDRTTRRLSSSNNGGRNVVVPSHLRHYGFNVTASVEADVASRLDVRDVQRPRTAEPSVTSASASGVHVTENQTEEFGGNRENDLSSTSLPLYPARDTTPPPHISSTITMVSPPPPPDSQHSDGGGSSSSNECSLVADEESSIEDSSDEDEDEPDEDELEEEKGEEEEQESDNEMDTIITNAGSCPRSMEQQEDVFLSLTGELQPGAELLHDSDGDGSGGGGVNMNNNGVVGQAQDATVAVAAVPEDLIDGLDPEVLAALPSELQEEVLENEARRKREQDQQLDPSRAEDIDNASFIASLTPELRRDVLSMADNTFLRTLPPNLVAEAMLVRERGPHAMDYDDEEEDSGSGGEEMQLDRITANADMASGRNHGSSVKNSSTTATTTTTNPIMNLSRFWVKHSDDVPLKADAWITLVRFLYLQTSIRNQKDLMCIYEHLCEMNESVMRTVVHSFTGLIAGDRIAVLAATKEFLLLMNRNGGGSGGGGGFDDSSSFTSEDDWRTEYKDGVVIYQHHTANEQQVLLPYHYLIGSSGNGSIREDTESVVVQRVIKVLQHLVQSSPRVCYELLTAQILPYRRKKRKRAGNGEPSSSNYHPPLQILDYLLSQVERLLYSTSHRNMKQLLTMLGWLVKPLGELNDDNHSKQPPPAQAQATITNAEEEEKANAAAVRISSPVEPEGGNNSSTSTSSSSSFMEHVPIPRPIISSECLHKLCHVLLLSVCDQDITGRIRIILKSLCKISENRVVLVDELVNIATQLGRVLWKDLCKIASDLHETTMPLAMDPADTCGAYNIIDDVQGNHVGVKFLGVLEILRWLIGSDADGVLTSSNFVHVWLSLERCLEALRPLEKSNMPDGDGVAAHNFLHHKNNSSSSSSHHSSMMMGINLKGLGTFGAIVAWGLLPIIEAFFVANKRSTINDISQEINISGLQLQQAPQCTTMEEKLAAAAATPNPLQQNSLLAFVAANHTLINSLLHKNPRLMDLAFNPMASDPACRKYLDFGNKLVVFRYRMKAISQQSSRRTLHINVPRDGVFEHSYHQTCVRSPNDMRGKLHVKFQGEEGVDAGGLTREWFSILAKEIFNENYALFIATSDGTTFQPNPLSGVNPGHLAYFKFVGRITGKAIADDELFPAPYTCSFYKHILGVPVTFADLEAIDSQFYSSLSKILEENVSVEELGLDLTFVAEQNEFGRVEMVELMPNGRSIPVTDENKFDYVKLIAAHRMTSAISPQIEAFLEGFHDIIPSELVSLFSPKELELLLNGLPDIDLEDLYNNTEYYNFKPSDPEIRKFWTVLRSFTQEEKALFLHFVTGTSRVPLEGFSHLKGMRGIQKFNISRAFGSPNSLPQSSTCFNTLKLPSYDTEEQCRDRLLFAIREGNTGFGFV